MLHDLTVLDTRYAANDIPDPNGQGIASTTGQFSSTVGAVTGYGTAALVV